MTTEEAGGVPRSRRLRDATGAVFQRLKTSGGLTISWGDPQTTRATGSPTFHTQTARGYEIREHGPAKSQTDHFG